MYRIHSLLLFKIVNAIVIDKEFRNKSTESRSSRAKVLKLRFEHPHSGPTEYACDTSILTPFYQVNDVLKVYVVSFPLSLRQLKIYA